VLRAKVTFNGEIFVISPVYRTFIINQNDLNNVFTATINNIQLGKELLLTLEASNLDWSHEVTSIKQSTEKYKIWKDTIIREYKYKNKRALFKNMNSCTVTKDDNTMLIAPCRHETLEGWGRVKGDTIYDITIPANSSPEMVGETLRIGLERAAEM
jgi:hypothetical protein